MFPWNIAKSAETMFTRLAVTRLCKFLLKKKLGQFLLGDIDLDQLDIQLGEGTIQLSDLALNVDYLNEKFGAAASLIIKEGSIGTLLMRMPWKSNGLEVEIDELEIVLAPWTENQGRTQVEPSSSGQENHGPCDSEKSHQDVVENAVKSTSANVHEGVKTIAKMVKWLLTSFHIKITKLIVAFDPSLEDRERTMCNTTLVLRISDIECGTCLSEDGNLNNNAKVESFLGISQLTNFVKFQGAVLELLQLGNGDESIPELTSGEYCSGCSLPNAAVPIVMGGKGGFSGNIKLSVPWKDGSLDISRVDADIFIDKIQVKLQPGTIKQFLLLWKAYRSLDDDARGYIPNKSNDSDDFGSESPYPSSVPSASGNQSCGSFPSNIPCSMLQESVTEGLPGSHLISDWVPFSVKQIEKEGIEEEFDFGASMDRFFDCLDGMRSFPSALGSSGIWQCSVFSAITAASSLASGSLHIPSEKQHVETNLKANFTGISVSLSFHDENQKNYLGPEQDQINVGSDVYFLVAECNDIFLAMQVSPQEMSFNGSVKHIDVGDYLRCRNDPTGSGLHDDNINRKKSQVQCLQADVFAALPPFDFPSKDPNELNGSDPENFQFGNVVAVSKITLLETSGITSFRINVISSSVDGSSNGSKSFSLKVAPILSWVNFPSIYRLLDLCKEVESSVPRNNSRRNVSSELFNENNLPSCGDVKISSSHVKALSSTERLQGDILTPNARVILCFPFESEKETGVYSSWDQFIALDFSPTSNKHKGTTEDGNLTSGASSIEKYSSASDALHLNLGNLEVFLVSSLSKTSAEINFGHVKADKFSAQRILAATSKAGCLITLFWQKGCITGPWVAKKAKSLAALRDPRGRHNFVGKGHEFASVSTVKHLEDSNSQTREEIILSSTSVLHVYLPLVTINLNRPQYESFNSLLDQLKIGLSSVACDASDETEVSSVSQASVLVDCDCVEISISPDVKENIKSSMQSELPGSWYHLRLKVAKFQLMSVSKIGGIRDANFFWLTHGEGRLLGSITGLPEQEFLLILCSNSTLKRGDGECSNALASRLAGFDIVHLWDQESCHSYTSMTVRCGTVVAVGGRLDWIDALSSFFSLSSEVEQAGDPSMQREEPNKSSGSSFTLSLVDIGLSYEPYINNMGVNSDLLGSASSCSSVKQRLSEDYIACLLAASSLTISNSSVANAGGDDYRIMLQDFGLLLCAVSDPENLGGTYSVEHLRKMGYVKVAHETLVEAILRTNCRNGLLWELEFSEWHIQMDTCHDTTIGLIRLGAQLQQLFAPDLEDSIMHLQTRWNNVQRAQERKYFNDEPSSPQGHLSSPGKQNEVGIVGLMNEICEDAFLFDKSQTFEYDSTKAQIRNPLDESLQVEVPVLNSANLPLYGSVPVPGLESNQTSFMQEGCFTECIEGYCLTEMHPLLELSLGGQLSAEIPKNVVSGDIGRGSNGWYGDIPLSIVENHISEPSTSENSVEDNISSIDSINYDEIGNACGRVLLKSVDVRWNMYAGLDWKGNGDCDTNACKRDSDACMELVLSGMQVLYDVFPAGGTCLSKLSLSVQDFHLCDSSIDAPWRLVLGYYNSKNHPRKSSSKAFKLELETIRPDPSTPLEEYLLHIAFLPMLLHLHQRQLDFLINFFGGKGSTVNQSPGHNQDSNGSQSMVTSVSSAVEEALLPYFQKFDIQPILIRVDYSPSRVDLAALRGGKYVELVNLVRWKGVELQLKSVHAIGVYGWGNVCETIIGEWLEDISQNQVHKILGGLPTIRSLVAVGAGASKLVSLPVESYRKDRRVLKGMQRGTVAFLRSISIEAVGLGVHLAAGAQDILLQAEYILTSVPPSLNVKNKRKTSVRSNQPKDAQEGIKKAFESLSDGLGKSASALVQNPLKKYQRGASAGSALATAVRALPTAAMAPASACASAIHYTLLGFRNSLDPERKRESMEKYLGPTESLEEN